MSLLFTILSALGQLGGPDPDALPYLALRRWLEGGTLTSPVAAPSTNPYWAWLAGVAALLVLVLGIQGIRRSIGQLLDLRGHARLLAASLSRLKRSARLVVVLLGVTVLSWTYTQLVNFSNAARIDDLAIFASNKSLREQVAEQSVLAAITPLRDLCSLGDELLLLAAATALVFKLTASRWGATDDPYEEIENPLPRSTLLCWGTTWLYGMYRFAVIVAGPDGLPLGGCLVLEAAVVPVLMAFSDGILLAWVVTELRNASRGDDEGWLDLRAAIRLWPAATLACVAVLPGRYVATAFWLTLPYVPTGFAQQFLAPLLGGWGLVYLQAGAIVFAAAAGAAAWSGGKPIGLARAYGRMLRAEGGRVVAVVVLTGLSAGAAVGAVSLSIFSLPRRSWLLVATDGYAHYATLGIGLIGLAALVELGARSLPRAVVAARPEPEAELIEANALADEESSGGQDAGVSS